MPFIRSGEINSTKTELFISEEALKKSSAKLVNKNDLLLAIYGATSGEVSISKIDGAINQAILCIRGDFINSFLYNWFKFNKGKIVSTYLQGGQGNLSSEIVKELKMPYPSIPEQQKIAQFLTALDKKIVHTTSEIDKMKEWKRGLLQKMFV